MSTLVKFILVDSTVSDLDMLQYVNNMIEHLLIKGLITEIIIDKAIADYGCESTVIEVEEYTYITNFYYCVEDETTVWQQAQNKPKCNQCIASKEKHP